MNIRLALLKVLSYGLCLLPAPLESQEAKTIFKNPSVVAEWERADGVFISYPFKLPDQLVVDFAKDSQLYVLVAESEKSKARTKLTELGVVDSVELIDCSVDSEWPRDWGPHQIFDAQGRLGIVDPDFDGYPVYRQQGGDAVYTFRPGKGDDKVNVEIAKFFGVPFDACSAFVTGGNFLVDGYGTAFCTAAILEENKNRYDLDSLTKLLKIEMGITRLVILENTEAVGIQHIDCWMKVLNPSTLLVKRAPQGHADEPFLERNVKKLSTLKNAFGRPFKIVRIDCPRVKVHQVYEDSDPIAAYTNSLMLNDNVYVPLFDCEGDDAALETWRKALPGYTVRGYAHNNWLDFDALHCRSRALFDADAARLHHRPLERRQTFSDSGFALTVNARSGNQKLETHQAVLNFRKRGQSWKQLSLAWDASSKNWKGSIPSGEPGSTVDYYITVSDKENVVGAIPSIAPKNYFTIEIIDSK